MDERFSSSKSPSALQRCRQLLLPLNGYHQPMQFVPGVEVYQMLQRICPVPMLDYQMSRKAQYFHD